MQSRILIDAIVRQTTVLIAEVSTAAGIRAPLAHLADQVFLELSHAIESQGVSKKIAADMFGMALRSYQKKVTRLSQSVTDESTTLWEAILGYLKKNGTRSRTDIVERFKYDDPHTVKAVLNDLVTSGLAHRSGLAENTIYGLTSDEDLQVLLTQSSSDALETMIWLRAYRAGELSVAELVNDFGLPEDELRGPLARLQFGWSGRIMGARWRTNSCSAVHGPPRIERRLGGCCL